MSDAFVALGFAYLT